MPRTQDACDGAELTRTQHIPSPTAPNNGNLLLGRPRKPAGDEGVFEIVLVIMSNILGKAMYIWVHGPLVPARVCPGLAAVLTHLRRPTIPPGDEPVQASPPDLRQVKLQPILMDSLAASHMHNVLPSVPIYTWS